MRESNEPTETNGDESAVRRGIFVEIVPPSYAELRRSDICLSIKRLHVFETMPPLTGLEFHHPLIDYKDAAPTALSLTT